LSPVFKSAFLIARVQTNFRFLQKLIIIIFLLNYYFRLNIFVFHRIQLELLFLFALSLILNMCCFVPLINRTFILCLIHIILFFTYSISLLNVFVYLIIITNFRMRLINYFFLLFYAYLGFILLYKYNCFLNL